MQFTRATAAHLDAVFDNVVRARRALDERGIHQWDEQYPSRSFLSGAIERGELYVLTADGAVVGSAVLNERQDVEWEPIEWRQVERPFLVLHTLVVDPAAQGQRYGDALLRECERFAAEQGYASIRIDVCATNPIALGFYQRRGYEHRGDIFFDFKPTGHQRYSCYEKMVDVQ